MTVQMKHSILSLRPAGSEATTPQSSRYPSAYPSEDDEPSEDQHKPFRFLDLPSELRTKIYTLLFLTAPTVIDLDPDNFRTIHKHLSFFRVCRQIHDEASHHFYSTHSIRLFPCHPGRFFKTKKPLLARLSPRYRASLTSLELRLGPGFANPPRGWVVNDALGLGDTTRVRVLKVMVQVDTSNPMFNGYRGGKDTFYLVFCQNLLGQVLSAVPSIVEVQFDAYPSVEKTGDMMRALLRVVKQHKKIISWGPERGWNDQDNDDWVDDILLAKPSLLEVLKEIAIVA